jgi:hypothetical protein
VFDCAAPARAVTADGALVRSSRHYAFSWLSFGEIDEILDERVCAEGGSRYQDKWCDRNLTYWSELLERPTESPERRTLGSVGLNLSHLFVDLCHPAIA